jgi:hypothetical protein
MTYPEEFIRGIVNEESLDKDGRASASMFQFIDTQRNDEFIEASINWFDDEEALSVIMKQRKECGEIQFKIGAAILSRSMLDMLLKSHTTYNRLSYERKAIEGNKYHGNLLLLKGLERKTKVLICGIIASCVNRIKPQDFMEERHHS